MIAVFLHLYYQDLWDEIEKCLSRIPFNFDLYVTISEEFDDTSSHKILNFKKDTIIKKIPNRGVDVGSFFEILNLTFDLDKKYDWILKIHSKKSLIVNSKKGSDWRKNLLSSLISSNFNTITKLFSNKKIGMIGSKRYLMSYSSTDKRLNKNNNSINIDYFLKRLNISDSKLLFFGGTMFWIRYSILKDTFKDNRITLHDFGIGHAPDGTRAHAMERVFANIVRDKKYELYAI